MCSASAIKKFFVKPRVVITTINLFSKTALMFFDNYFYMIFQFMVANHFLLVVTLTNIYAVTLPIPSIIHARHWNAVVIKALNQIFCMLEHIYFHFE